MGKYMENESLDVMISSIVENELIECKSQLEKKDVLIDNLITILIDETMANYANRKEWYENLKQNLCYTDKEMAEYCGLFYNYEEVMLYSS